MRQNLLDRAVFERFLAEKTQANESGCLVWHGPLTGGGYARVQAPWGGTIAVHRLVYIVFVGPLRDDLEIHHTCGTRACCNVAHLVAVNDIDHKRADVNWVGNRTHCTYGHELSGDNLSPALLMKRGIRRCKLCAARRTREHRARDPEGSRKHAREAMKAWIDKDRQRNRDYQRERRKKLQALKSDPVV